MKNDHLTPRNEPIRAGEAAPDFVLLDQDRKEWKLSEAARQGDVVLCFYPLDFSPVCSTEMKCVTDEMERFASKGAKVVGVSCDSFFTHRAWADSLGLKQPLLADMHRQVCKAYGLFFADLNCASRGTVVIGKATDGRPKVKWVQAREIKDAMKNDDVIGAIS